jgi:hypothetical protein
MLVTLLFACALIDPADPMDRVTGDGTTEVDADTELSVEHWVDVATAYTTACGLTNQGSLR